MGEVALDILLQVEKGGAYSNLLLHTNIEKNRVSAKDTGLLTEIVYGTIQREATLDYFLQPFIQNQRKIQTWVRMLLRMSVYQMEFLDRVPPHAIFNEAVEIAKKRGHRGVASFVNGVLRSIQREGVPSLDLITDETKRLAVETSHPLWLVEDWVAQYGMETTRAVCETNLLPPTNAARVNVTKTSVAEILGEYPAASVGTLSSDAILFDGGNIANTEAFKTGKISIQDESSMLVARALGAKPGETVLDCCSAPGGKTTHIAERMNNSGKVYAFDLHKHKVKLIKKQTERLGLTNVEASAYDARNLQDIFPPATFDHILVDAPCSGFGVLRRKPDLKKGKEKADIERLATIQQDILTSVALLLKPGGTLVYSTCTIGKEENSQVVAAFLKNHPSFAPDETLANRLPEKTHKYIQNGTIQILPHYFQTDGFFIASLKKEVTKE